MTKFDPSSSVEYLVRVGARLSEEQLQHLNAAVIRYLFCRVSTMEAQDAVDHAIKRVKSEYPSPMRAAARKG